MQYDAQVQKVPALSRTWETVTRDRMDGAVIQERRHTVTISNYGGIASAEIDGEPANVLDAASILAGASSRSLIAEVKPFPASMARALGLSA